MSPKELMDLTQTKRLHLIAQLEAKGPLTDPDEIKLYQSLLRDIDNTAGSTIKLKIDAAAVAVAGAAAMNAAAIIREAKGNPFLGTGQRGAPVAMLPDITPVPGQELVGQEELKYEDFVKEDLPD